MTTVKINVDKVSMKVFFKTMAKMNDHMNETSFLHSMMKRRVAVDCREKCKRKLQIFICPINFLIILF